MIFFTSDLHFGHANVIQYCNRPFKTVEHMNETLVSNWNSVVKGDDTVYVLGDFAMGSAENVVKYGSRLNGHKILIPGNHDRCHEVVHKNKEQKRSNSVKLFLDAGFEIAGTQGTVTIGDHLVKLCHFPYSGDHTQDIRYQQYRPEDKGHWLLHGHVHDLWLVKDKQINVGVDVWNFYPVPITTIKEVIDSQFDKGLTAVMSRFANTFKRLASNIRCPRCQKSISPPFMNLGPNYNEAEGCLDCYVLVRGEE